MKKSMLVIIAALFSISAHANPINIWGCITDDNKIARVNLDKQNGVNVATYSYTRLGSEPEISITRPVGDVAYTLKEEYANNILQNTQYSVRFVNGAYTYEAVQVNGLGRLNLYNGKTLIKQLDCVNPSSVGSLDSEELLKIFPNHQKVQDQ